jgi:hypothetical protein
MLRAGGGFLGDFAQPEYHRHHPRPPLYSSPYQQPQQLQKQPQLAKYMKASFPKKKKEKEKEKEKRNAE